MRTRAQYNWQTDRERRIAIVHEGRRRARSYVLEHVGERRCEYCSGRFGSTQLGLPRVFLHDRDNEQVWLSGTDLIQRGASAARVAETFGQSILLCLQCHSQLRRSTVVQVLAAPAADSLEAGIVAQIHRLLEQVNTAQGLGAKVGVQVLARLGPNQPVQSYRAGKLGARSTDAR